MFCHISVLWKVLLCEMCCYVKSVGCCVSYRWAKWKVPVCERCCYVKGASMWKVPVVVCHIGSYVKCAGIWKVLLCERCQYEKGVGCCVIQVSYVKGAVMWKVQDCRYVKSVAMWKVPVCERCRLLCVSYSWAMWKVYVYVKGAAMWNVLLCERCCYVKRVVMWNVLFIVCVVQVSYVKCAAMWNVLLCEMCRLLCVSYRWAMWKVPVCETCCYVKCFVMWNVPVAVCVVQVSYLKGAGCVACCCIMSQDRIFMCHEDVQTNDVRTLGSLSIALLNKVFVDPENDTCCVLVS